MSNMSETRRGKFAASWLPGVLLWIGAMAPGGSDPPLLTSEDFPGLTVKQVERFEGKALYGYIDGGAELVYEYGFTRLAVQHVTAGGEEFTLESYLMRDDLAAIGLFSVSRGGCVSADSLGPFSCRSRYQVLWASSQMFLRLINPAGSAAGERIALELARILHRKIPGGSPVLPAVLGASGLPLEECRYVRGPLGVQNGFDTWSDLFDEAGLLEAYILPGNTDNGAVTVAQAEFADSSGCARFIRRFDQGAAVHRYLWRQSPTRVVAIESVGAENSLRERIEKAVMTKQ